MVRCFDNKKHGHSFDVAYTAIHELSKSQGFYSRMLAAMQDDNWDTLFELTKTQYFNNAIDFIMFVEC